MIVAAERVAMAGAVAPGRRRDVPGGEQGSDGFRDSTNFLLLGHNKAQSSPFIAQGRDRPDSTTGLNPNTICNKLGLTIFNKLGLYLNNLTILSCSQRTQLIYL